MIPLLCAISIDDDKVGVGDAFLLGAAILVQEMLVRSEDDFLLSCVVLAESLVDQRDDEGRVVHQNRLEHAYTGVTVGAENLQASESRIRDTDMASEMVEYTKNQVLKQAGTAMLAQANQSSQNVLSLLQ